MRQLYCVLIFCMVFLPSNAQEKEAVSSHYLFPEFLPGVILMHNGLKHDMSLNYNSLTQEMIFESEGKKLAIAKNEMGLIDTVFIQQRKFIPSQDHFVEIISHGKWDVYVQHKCKTKDQGKSIGYGSSSKTTAITSYSSFYSSGDLYELKLPDIYEIDNDSHYWLKKNGEVNQFTSLSELRKLYKDKKVLFKAYVKKHRVKYDNQQSIIQLIEYLESIQNDKGSESFKPDHKH